MKKIAWIHSHELRVPVANILGLSALFNVENCSDPANSEVLTLLINSTRQLDQMIRKITDYTID